MSEFGQWKDKEHAEDWLVFPKNIGPKISIDETALSNGELHTVVTNKEAHGKKGTLVAIIKGTKAEQVITVLNKIPESKRRMVKEITLDMTSNMELIAKKSFPIATQALDRFHVQKLADQAVQEMRIKHRWKAIDKENEKLEDAKTNKTKFVAHVYENGDTAKQLLARSRYLLFKSENKWTESQKERAQILFEHYPDIKQAYDLAQKLRHIFENTDNSALGRTRLALWHEKVDQAGFKNFNTVSKTLQLHYQRVVNYFTNRSTNASAESFNAKIKNFRRQFRGVRSVPFFLFRLDCKIFLLNLLNPQSFDLILTIFILIVY